MLRLLHISPGVRRERSIVVKLRTYKKIITFNNPAWVFGVMAKLGCSKDNIFLRLACHSLRSDSASSEEHAKGSAVKAICEQCGTATLNNQAQSLSAFAVAW